MAFDGHVYHRVEQRMPGGDQRGRHLTRQRHVIPVEGDPLVFREHWGPGGAAATLSVPVADDRRHVRHLVPPGLPRRDAPAEAGEGGQEERPDVERLQPAGLHLLHPSSNPLDVSVGHRVVAQRPLGEQLVEPFADGRVDDDVEPLAHLRLVAVADRLPKQGAQRLLGEGVAEHVEHLARISQALLLDLLQQPREHLALPGVGGDQVPQVAHLGLPDPVDAAEPLLDPVGVPGQVVVDHQVGALQIQALSGGVGGHQHPHVRVGGELLLHDPPLFAAHPAMDRHDRLRPAEQGADLVDQVVQGVAVLGEDDDLATFPRVTTDQALVGQDGAQLGPLAVGARVPHPAGQLGQVGKDGDLGGELDDGLGCGGSIDDFLLERLGLVAVEVVPHVVEVVRVGRAATHELCQPLAQLRLGTAIRHGLHLPAPSLEPIAPPLQAAQDRLRAGRQAPLQHGHREANGVAATALTLGFEPVGAVHLLPHVLGDRLVQLRLRVGQLIGHRVGNALGEQRPTLHRQQLLLDHPSHQVPWLHRVHPVAVAALEPVAIK